MRVGFLVVAVVVNGVNFVLLMPDSKDSNHIWFIAFFCLVDLLLMYNNIQSECGFVFCDPPTTVSK